MIVLRNIGAVLAGVVLGSMVNIALVNLGPHVISLPEGADVTTMEGLRDSMMVMKPANFIFPYLGHALGTLVGALVAAKIATTRRLWFGVGISLWFLFGGVAAVVLFGGPMWFKVLDLLTAYIPMGWLGGKLGGGNAAMVNKPDPTEASTVAA